MICPNCHRDLVSRASPLCNWCGYRIHDQQEWERTKAERERFLPTSAPPAKDDRVAIYFVTAIGLLLASILIGAPAVETWRSAGFSGDIPGRCFVGGMCHRNAGTVLLYVGFLALAGLSFAGMSLAALLKRRKTG